jgi:hypothetical protein
MRTLWLPWAYCMSSIAYGILSMLGQPDSFILLNHIRGHVGLVCCLSVR